MDLTDKATRLEKAVEAYDKARDRGYYLEENPRWEALRQEVQGTIVGLKTVGWTWFEGADRLFDVMQAVSSRPRFHLIPWRRWRAWSLRPQSWGVEVMRPVFVRYWKWGPLVVRLGFYARKADEYPPSMNDGGENMQRNNRGPDEGERDRQQC